MVGEQLKQPVSGRTRHPVRAAVFTCWLGLLTSVMYFAIESLEPDQPIFDIFMVIVLGSCALALGWVVVDGWWSRRTDRI